MGKQDSRTEGSSTSDVTVEEVIAAPAQVLYDLVSDVTRMGDWSPETRSCRWVGGATGPRVGARFRGSNRNGWRRWSTSCTVVAADPGARFSFDVDLPGLPVSRWTYEFVSEGPGTRVRESWTDRRPGWMDRFGKVVRGVSDTKAHNRAGMEATLAALRRHAESRSSPG
ncbi:MAG TPA: SRPBCC family protein [Acidimicrobiales bacterium]|nr:SRPBCC family protein [Acidimicrobiales bacterium]